MKQIELKFGEKKKISDTLYGIFLEDINFACDGGLNANLVNNYSFDGLYLDSKTLEPVEDPLRYWIFSGCTAESLSKNPVSEHSKYARVSVTEQAKIQNLGYTGNKEYISKPAMYIMKGADYRFSCYIRGSFNGTISVALLDGNDCLLTEEKEVQLSPNWTIYSICLKGVKEGYGVLTISLNGHGTVDLDLVTFLNTDYWNAKDPKWTGGKFRKDLVETLAELKPTFMRFPGGCIVEGRTKGNEYDWKDTVGELKDRKPKANLWAEKTPDGGYCQSYQIGFYEYFCLCEDLNMKPLPVLTAGVCCQFRTFEWLPEDSEAFRYEVQNYLDLIEFATGDPKQNQWAKLRADMGHPGKFNLEMIGVGNENFGPHYNKRFKTIEKAIHEKYPAIKLVYAAGGVPIKPVIYPMWKFAKQTNPDGLLDEHSYNPPEWFIRNANRYDSYERGTTKVYIGEYAANGNFLLKVGKREDNNIFRSALAEAAFLTGVERNGDVVAMTSYAPLFNLVSGTNWYHNLIDFCPGRVSKTANYYVQQMFGANYAPCYISPVAELPENVFASATTDGETIFLKLVNAGTETIDFKIQTKHKTAECQLLHAQGQDKNILSFEGNLKEAVTLQISSLSTVNGKVSVSLPAESVMVVKL